MQSHFNGLASDQRWKLREQLAFFCPHRDSSGCVILVRLVVCVVVPGTGSEKQNEHNVKHYIQAFHEYLHGNRIYTMPKKWCPGAFGDTVRVWAARSAPRRGAAGEAEMVELGRRECCRETTGCGTENLDVQSDNEGTKQTWCNYTHFIHSSGERSRGGQLQGRHFVTMRRGILRFRFTTLVVPMEDARMIVAMINVSHASCMYM